MHTASRVFALCGLLSVVGCSSIVEGRSQELVVNTNPPEASCALIRKDMSIGTVGSTPGSILIEKTKNDLTIKCNKDGYQESTYLNKSDVDAWTFGNIVFGFGGLIGWAIDSSAGADNKYESPMNITLVPQQPAAALGKKTPAS